MARHPHPAPARNHLRDQPALHRRHPRPFPGRRRARGPRQPGRGRGGEAHQDGEPRDRRLAQHERRRRDSFRASAHDDRARPRRGVSRPLPQHHQRRHAAALAPAGQSVPRAGDFGCDRRLLDRRSHRNCANCGRSWTTPRSERNFARPNARPRRVSRTGSRRIRGSSSTRTRSSIARSSAFTNTNGSS